MIFIFLPIKVKNIINSLRIIILIVLNCKKILNISSKEEHYEELREVSETVFHAT